MLGALTTTMRGLVARLSGSHKLTEANISDAISEVRLALLEADVNYGVAKDFVKSVKAKALGDQVIKSVTPGQQFIKLVHDELVELMGGEQSSLDISDKPAKLMLCGLQGSGKTTACAKLGRWYKRHTDAKNVLLIACDLQRPGAVEQLQQLGAEAAIDVFTLAGEKDPLKVAQQALEKARKEPYDLLIFDTAGRLHVDEAMMAQLEALHKLVAPHYTLFVANGATGQDAPKVAAQFGERVPIAGSILTMLDGNARGGAAISIRQVTGKPLLFEGTGEKLADLQPFNPESMADRILGMGDTINLVRKAQEHVDEDQAKELEKKLRKATFTYEDYLAQMRGVKQMGSLKGLLSMLPGLGNMEEMEFDESRLLKIEAIIQSMTPQERQEKCELTSSRRKRLAQGSGTTLDEVNKLVKSFRKAKQFCKNMPTNMKQLTKMMGGMSWR